MTAEVLALIEVMVKVVAELNYEGIAKVDSIWDENYDKLVELAIDENCRDKTTCDEEAIHDEMADIRVLYYKKADEHSYECKECGKRLYGKRPLEENFLCKNCKK